MNCPKCNSDDFVRSTGAYDDKAHYGEYCRTCRYTYNKSAPLPEGVNNLDACNALAIELLKKDDSENN